MVFGKRRNVWHEGRDPEPEFEAGRGFGQEDGAFEDAYGEARRVEDGVLPEEVEGVLARDTNAADALRDVRFYDEADLEDERDGEKSSAASARSTWPAARDTALDYARAHPYAALGAATAVGAMFGAGAAVSLRLIGFAAALALRSAAGLAAEHVAVRAARVFDEPPPRADRRSR